MYIDHEALIYIFIYICLYTCAGVYQVHMVCIIIIMVNNALVYYVTVKLILG